MQDCVGPLHRRHPAVCSGTAEGTAHFFFLARGEAVGFRTGLFVERVGKDGVQAMERGVVTLHGGLNRLFDAVVAGHHEGVDAAQGRGSGLGWGGLVGAAGVPALQPAVDRGAVDEEVAQRLGPAGGRVPD